MDAFFQPTLVNFMLAASLMLTALLLVWAFDKDAQKDGGNIVYVTLSVILVVCIVYSGLELIRLGV